MNNILLDNSSLSNKLVIDSDNNYIINISDYNLDIEILVKKNCDSKIYMNGNNLNSNITINLEEDSYLSVDSFFVNNNSKIIINLNGEKSNCRLNNSVISTIDNEMGISINHNVSNTISNIYNSGYNYGKSKIVFNVDGCVYKDSFGCICNQDNKIISDKHKLSKILPNLFIENYDVEANHSAYIGDVSKNDLFYLMSRCISKRDAYVLLINAFLIGKFEIDEEEKEKISLIINDILRKED